VNALVRWNTRCMHAALGRLRPQGRGILDEVVERLSPLGYEHVNLLGRYHFSLTESVARGPLRPLRDAAEGVGGIEG
jgi:hypothetical protein